MVIAIYFNRKETSYVLNKVIMVKEKRYKIFYAESKKEECNLILNTLREQTDKGIWSVDCKISYANSEGLNELSLFFQKSNVNCKAVEAN